MENENSKKNTPTILIVDDISVNVTILENMLEHEGYKTMSALSVQEALELMKETRPSLILSDLSMPEIDGLEFCRMLKSDQATRDIPFIFITVLNTSKEKEEAFTAGAVDFIPKPFDNVEVLMRVNNHLGSYRLRQEMADYNRMMHKLVKDQKKQIEAEHTNVLQALSGLVRRKNPEKGVHQDNVGYNCRLLAQGLQFLPEYEDVVTDEFVEAIGIAARLRDIGCFVLSLDPEEQGGEVDGADQEYIRRCAEEGSRLLKEFGEGQEGGALYMAGKIVEYYRARWDGSGYPEVSGKQIPLEARIVSVANDFDELLTAETGREACSMEKAVEIIQERSGKFYDPAVIQVFNRLSGRMRTN